MDNKSTTKRMIGAVVLVLIAALLLAWLLKGKNKSVQEQQDLIADQTQEASPILGFPGVNDEDKNANGTVAQNAGDGAATEDGSYVIGAADKATDNAQQQAQNALAAGGDAASSAGQTATDSANQVAAGAANAASQAGQQVANATGFQVRDPQNQDGDASAEQRPIVENGEVKAGTGSMGGSEVAAGTQDQQSSSGDATQTAGAVSGGSATQASGSGDSSASGGSAVQQATAGSDSSGGSSSGDAAKPAKKVANPKLVNEKPVPAPRTQSASASRSSGSTDGERSGSSSSRSANASSDASSGGDSDAVAVGGSGYAIQVLAASSRSKAEGVRKDIARDGYPAFVVRARVNGKTVYRVRVGTYPGKSAARSVQNKMKARYTKNQYVQNSFVTKN